MDVTLQTTFLGVKLKNPFLLASAPPTRSREMIERAFEAGWGGAIIKTLTQVEEPARRNVRPRIRALRESGRVWGFTNMELASMRSTEEWLADLAAIKKGYPDRGLGASLLYGGRPDERQWRAVARSCEDTGVDWLELNLSCPHGGAEEGGEFSIGSRPEAIREVVGWVREATSLPLIVKLPAFSDIQAGTKASMEAGADAVALINTLNALSGIDLDSWRPLPSVAGQSAFCGLSGRAVKPVALRCVALAASMDVPVSGMGGICDWRDAAEFLLAGASSLQVCSAVMERGYGIVDDLCRGLLAYLREKGCSSPDDLVGGALPHVVPHASLSRESPVTARCLQERCLRCGACFVSCRDAGHQAIEWRVGEYPAIDPDRCDGCGLCVGLCPSGSLSMGAR
ncbi:NAD-dependent dihydropyrimidine dehydrogenase subunit PreA [Aminithiophilus ramosus]|uniref:dihydrouracil dehydrogenase (NAD(+)) n=2 Tax=Synergistales TaxID=649776 RepID=A0A9Q7A9Q1_9BACT|nr:NAD-dependent dihydropyrimidine dehydrogenase subunit PreA [Aminithiophilus ramosus]QTX31368.1 NAD-dependent dihydropyrimidine dehydrogenase subunit PreA [Aminithiophilus ramosus]QVL35167.1 NAD-dependent dihydropyrimidine dehydrogenase subunit PreA [Synergistota bacterium]